MAHVQPDPPNTPSSISGPSRTPTRTASPPRSSLLTDHGWTIVNGVQTCTKPGTGSNRVRRGHRQAARSSHSASSGRAGHRRLTRHFAAEISAWKSIGIPFTHSEASFNDVIAQCNGGSFQICMWGAGWIYSPGLLPIGRDPVHAHGRLQPRLVQRRAHDDADRADDVGHRDLTAYGNYAAQQLPVLYEPNPTATGEVSKSLKGVQPVSPLQNFMPEYNYF